MGNERLKKKCGELDRKIDFLIKDYLLLKLENKELIFKISQPQADIEKKNIENRYSEQEILIQSRLDRFLKKLNTLSK